MNFNTNIEDKLWISLKSKRKHQLSVTNYLKFEDLLSGKENKTMSAKLSVIARVF